MKNTNVKKERLKEITSEELLEIQGGEGANVITIIREYIIELLGMKKEE